MKAAGVDVLFANGGTDFPSIIEGYANSSESGISMPEPLAIAHEGVALGMAHGYYLLTGKPAGVMVHVNDGLANSVTGVVNAASDNIPVVMCSGRTPITEYGRFGSRNNPIHWGQEMRDQAAMIREVVKWDYEPRYPEQAALAVDRAVNISMSEPRGPVYLSLPREVLAEWTPGTNRRGAPDVAPTTYAAAAPAEIERAAELIANAERPIVVTQSPDHHEGFGVLPEMAERYGLPVVEYWATRQSLPTTHPMHGDRDPMPWVREADVIVGINSMVPWIADYVTLPDGCKVIEIGPDPLHHAVPMRSFEIDVSLAGGTNATLATLSDALDRIVPRGTEKSRQRARVEYRSAEQKQSVEKLLAAGKGKPMNAAWVSHCLSEAADDNTSFFNELGVDPAVMSFSAPKTFFSSPLSGGLGWGMPAALGAQYADRTRQVIACVGDGSYMFANPVACHQTAAALGLPLLTVVFNNGIWNAVPRSTLYMYPKGKAAAANTMPITSLSPSPDYAGIARAHGAHAERVDDGAELPAAIERTLATTRVGQQALLEVMVTY